MTCHPSVDGTTLPCPRGTAPQGGTQEESQHFFGWEGKLTHKRLLSLRVNLTKADSKTIQRCVTTESLNSFPFKNKCNALDLISKQRGEISPGASVTLWIRLGMRLEVNTLPPVTRTTGGQALLCPRPWSVFYLKVIKRWGGHCAPHLLNCGLNI